MLKAINSCCSVRCNIIFSVVNEGKATAFAIGADFYTLSIGMAELLNRGGGGSEGASVSDRAVHFCIMQGRLYSSCLGFFLREFLRSFLKTSVQ